MHPRALPRQRPDRPARPPAGTPPTAHAIAQGTREQAAIIGLAAFAGPRACEISRLDWAEVGLGDGGSQQIRVVDGKGGHGRIVPLALALAELLAALPHRRGPVVRPGMAWAGHVQPWTVSKRINEYLHRVGVAETLHQCRHRFATATYAACRDIRAVQDLLGHASPTTTAIYAAVAPGIAVGAVQTAGRLAA